MNPQSRMTCKELLEFLADYLDGELPHEQLDVLETHLDKCGPCVDYLESYRSTISMIRDCVPKPVDDSACGDCPEELIKAVMEARRNEPGSTDTLH